MELLEPLPAYYERVGMPSTQEVALLGTDMCRALEACHAMGVVHRDVKPQNVFRDDFGHYRLGDFGISKQLGDMGMLTSTQVGRRGRATTHFPLCAAAFGPTVRLPWG